jgi:glutathione peroxidase
MKMNISNIEFKDSDDLTKTIKDYDAKIFLIVNTASKCGLTKQYESLQSLYKTYKDDGLEILAFPANEFLAQEPGSDTEIQEFCKINYDVTFPVNKKIIVKGDNQHPLYRALTDTVKDAKRNESNEFESLLTDKGLITGDSKDIHWNFEKFIVDSNGEVLDRFFPDVLPTDIKVTSIIDTILNK